MLPTWNIGKKMLACYLTPFSNSQGVQGLNLGEQIEERPILRKQSGPRSEQRVPAPEITAH